MSDELLRARRKLVALRRAEFALKQRFDKIDFEIDVLKEEVKALEKLALDELPTFELGDGE